MPASGTDQVDFYPVVHLLTGPPGLRRNGGIWKLIKRHLAEVSNPPRVMVQCLHFASYTLSTGAWDDWFEPYYDSTKLAKELDETFGPSRDVFVDSGGFQLLFADKIDLSKWGLKVQRDDILELQVKYRPQRIASLDSPIGPKVGDADALKLRRASIDNAAWLAGRYESIGSSTRPYLVVHGRNPDELEAYLKQLKQSLPRGWLRRHEYGIALGSQVPLAAQPNLVLRNAQTVLRWMKKYCRPETPFHVFGVGEGLMGRIQVEGGRPVSFDNSTWVQKAFRMRIFDPASATYKDYNPHAPPSCECAACKHLNKLGGDFVHALMTRPAYRPSHHQGVQVNRSDILALVALHNLESWEKRLDLPPTRLLQTNVVKLPSAPKTEYEFPLRQFRPKSENLLILACTKQRPYQKSRTHQLVLNELKDAGLHEGEDFDRITLSGLFGPVHWDHEKNPAILAYDFQLGNLVSETHRNLLKLRTANVLNVIRKKYEGAAVAYLPSKPYKAVFGPVIESFASHVADEIERVPRLLARSTRT
jgi:7-cyano-7-deazaguanine tRNA-ribosyltransferase